MTHTSPSAMFVVCLWWKWHVQA